MFPGCRPGFVGTLPGMEREPAMAFEAEALLDGAGRLLADAVELRRRLHRHPELGLDCPQTRRVVLDAICDLGLDVRTGTRTTSVVADLTGSAGDGPTILLRADMDGLPVAEETALAFASEVDGRMHACGHDAHVAMLVGAARLLAGMRDRIPGRVRFAFQPGEEGFHGARVMVEEGVLEDPHVDAVFALHVTPNVSSGVVTARPGPIMASADAVEIAVTGQGGHASSPHLANDPMPVAAEIVQALQVFATRRFDPFDPVVITITKIAAGTTNNVIPERVEMEGTVRAISAASRERALEGVERRVLAIAAAHEMEASLEVHRSYAPTVNESRFVGRVEGAVRLLLGDGAYREMPAPVMGAEDFSYLLAERPGALAFLGACPPGVEPGAAPACHSNRMTIDEDAMRVGIATHAAVALAYLHGTAEGLAGAPGTGCGRGDRLSW